MQQLSFPNIYHPSEESVAEKQISETSLSFAPLESRNQVLVSGDIVLDAQHHLVRKAGSVVHLQRVDFVLLEFLMRHPAHVFSSRALLEHVWGNAPTATKDGLRMSVSRLRKALDTSSSEKSIIETVHRVGYRLRTEST
jgi:two-component system, OmpR family, phosphate regulon response regulator PhoB